MITKPVVQTMPTGTVTNEAFRANLDLGFIYLNNPKVGCTTIKRSLWQAIAPASLDAVGDVHSVQGSPFVNRLQDAEAARTAFVFTFVRNPFQRLVSAYLDKIDGQATPNLPELAGWMGQGGAQPLTFDTFVELIAANPPEALNPHWRPQSINTLYPLIRPNLIADLEQLDEILPQILLLLVGARGSVIQGRAHGTTARDTWPSFYADPGTLRRVLDLYAVDFEVFGYRPMVSADPARLVQPEHSTHQHEGLGKFVALQAAKGPDRAVALNALAAWDKDGILSDWILGRRLMRVKANPERVRDLLTKHADQITTGADFLRRIAAEVQG